MVRLRHEQESFLRKGEAEGRDECGVNLGVLEVDALRFGYDGEIMLHFFLHNHRLIEVLIYRAECVSRFIPLKACNSQPGRCRFIMVLRFSQI